jgi:5-oxoprolinase (ATP-hydrolysing) subunit C
MTLRLLTPGLCTMLVDFGRAKSRSLGVPVGGAADRWSLALGNALVGNAPQTPALEIGLAGPTVAADCDLACVVFGAPFRLGTQKTLTVGTTFTLHRGEELRMETPAFGMRAYLCVRGGLQGKNVLGSQSSLEPLRAGSEFPCSSETISPRFFHPESTWNLEPKTLRTLDGPQAEWFRGEEFSQQAFRVSETSNRMGIRLKGQPLALPSREFTSEPVCPGAVQVTRDGQCIVLGVDGQTIGGYPKIAQVISADIDKIGQLRPTDMIRFHRVSLEEAETIYQQKQVELRTWLTRLTI